MELKEVVLTQLEAGVRRAIDERVMEGIGHVQAPILHEMGYAMTCELRSFIWTEAKEPIVFSYPATWWQAFKKEVLGIKDIKLSKFIVDPSILYPNMLVSVPNQKTVFRLAVRKS